jgi:hypothetical protein
VLHVGAASSGQAATVIVRLACHLRAFAFLAFSACNVPKNVYNPITQI